MRETQKEKIYLSLFLNVYGQVFLGGGNKDMKTWADTWQSSVLYYPNNLYSYPWVFEVLFPFHWSQFVHVFNESVS